MEMLYSLVVGGEVISRSKTMEPGDDDSARKLARVYHQKRHGRPLTAPIRGLCAILTHSNFITYT